MRRRGDWHAHIPPLLFHFDDSDGNGDSNDEIPMNDDCRLDGSLLFIYFALALGEQAHVIFLKAKS
jgi:hypothetical protein